MGLPAAFHPVVLWSVDPRWRNRLIAVAASLLAVWLGWWIADGAYTLPALAAAIGLAAVLVRMARLPADVILLGLLLIGYIVGNRGFAQLMPIRGLPLFPAELGLAVGAGWLVVHSALRQTAPWRRDWLNGLLLAWMAVGTARMAIDVRQFGFFALRDYAMVYYAMFFFLAQHYAENNRSRRYLIGCAGFAAAVLLPVYFLFSAYPLFFYTVLTVRGVPLIFLKGDLALTFLAAGSVVVFHLVTRRHRLWAWPLAAAMFLCVAAGNSRASLVGAVVAVLWLVAARRWAFPLVQSSVALLAFTFVIVLASSGHSIWAESKLDGVRERLVSIADVSGTRFYESSDVLDKGDNNRFRLVWWRTVMDETWSQGPVFGLGFGYDLAKDFIETYNPGMEESFSARSPHSIVVTTFGRMGLAGLAALAGLVGAMAVKTWRSLRDRTTDPAVAGLWCGAWAVFTSACFGVVLEGPMGAVVFWTLLGLANGAGAAPQVPGYKLQVPNEEGEERKAADLPMPATR